MAERAGLPLIIAGIVQDQEYFERFGRAPARRGAGHLHRPGRARRARGDLLGGARALLHLDQLRRAVRLQRRRGDGVRNAGDRLSRADRCPRSSAMVRTASWSTRSTRRSLRSARRRHWTGWRCAPRSSTASTSNRMVDDYLAVYHRVVALHRTRRRRRCRLTPAESERFRLGVNYWPARTAMGWWSDFDRAEVAADFARIAAQRSRLGPGVPDLGGLPAGPGRGGPARCWIGWSPWRIWPPSGFALVPTLFTGHMSGVNWIPAWALGGLGSRRPFPGGLRRQGHERRAAELVLGPGGRPALRRCWRARQQQPWPATKPSGCGISATRTRTA